MYPAQVKKLESVQSNLEAVLDFLNEKIENAGESDKAREKADALADVVSSIEQGLDSLEDAKSNLDGIE